MLARRTFVASAGLLAAPSIVRAQGQNGVALVIGNSKYKWEASLPNVKRDAPDVARRFQELGLRTELLQDAGRDAMFAAIEKFKVAASGANFAAVYFAGHGASWEKDTYLVPVDADLGTPETVRTLLPVAAARSALKGAAHCLLVLDNCRNNPADGWRQRAATEQARIAAAELAETARYSLNTLVLFSTAPGRVALDGPSGDNSPFAAAFLRQLAEPSIDLKAMAAKLRRDLLIATEGRQVIWDESTYAGPFTLNGPRNAPAKGAPSPVDPSRIVELPNAYVFARDKKLTLPVGLVAIRPQAGSPHASKIGAYHCQDRTYFGGANQVGNSFSFEPSVVIVASVPDAGTAELIVSSRDFAILAGAYWRFTTGKLSQDELVWTGLGGYNGPSNSSFKWTDAKAGKYALWGGVHMASPFSSSFTRLDG